MVRKLLCRWFGLIDPRTLPQPDGPREMEPLTVVERAALVASAYDHPGAKYLIDVLHNHRGPYSAEQAQLTNNIPLKADAEALLRRLCWLDGALAENLWFERQIALARQQAAENDKVSDATERTD